MSIVGCDPGKKGAIACSSGVAINLVYLDGELDTESLGGQLRIWSPSEIVLECPIAMPGQNPRDSITRGFEYGRIYERLRMLGYPVRVVRPNEWTKHLGQPKSTAGTPAKRSKEAKEWRIRKAKELYPDIVWAGDFDSRGGQADALLMAWVRSRGLI